MDDLTGRRFGRLVAESFSHKDRNKQFVWNVVCDCGTRKQVARRNLMGKTQSCGCLKRETNGASFRTHGLSGTKTHRVWKSMVARCHIPSATGFHNYGARGISVCSRWRESFSHFLTDMGECPAGMSIDRSDVNGNYEPGNCRWATRVEQGANKRNNVTFFVGVQLTMAQAAEKAGISYDAMRARRGRGWPDDVAVTSGRHAKRYAHRITAAGVARTVAEWAELLGMNPKSIRNRIGSGWSEVDSVTVPKGGARPIHVAPSKPTQPET